MMTTTGHEFSDWRPLTPDGLSLAPDEPGAVQLSCADKRLVPYPRGKSAMVFYFYAARSMREALRRLFADELEAPGARGEGPLAFRTMAGGDEARLHLETLYDRFYEQFGAPPVLHAVGGRDDDDHE